MARRLNEMSRAEKKFIDDINKEFETTTAPQMHYISDMTDAELEQAELAEESKIQRLSEI